VVEITPTNANRAVAPQTVTMMFSDLVGSTALSRLTEAHELLSG
jgi:class 3 adenylate cyclase